MLQPNYGGFKQWNSIVLFVFVSINIDRYLENAAHVFVFLKNTQHPYKTPFSSFPPSALLLLEGWGHRGRVKVTCGRLGVGCRAGPQYGRRGRYIKLTEHKCCFIHPVPLWVRGNPKVLWLNQLYPFLSLSFHSHPSDVCTLRTRMAASSAHRTSGPRKMLAFALLLIASFLNGE